MSIFAALDVSQELTAVCVVNLMATAMRRAIRSNPAGWSVWATWPIG